MNTQIETILQKAEAASASDIHLASGEPVAIRVDGEISFPPEFGTTTQEDVLSIIQALLTPETFQNLKQRKEYDFSYSHDEWHRYRCNVFYRKGALSLSMRRIKKKLLTLAEIGVPEQLTELLQKNQGLILISGPAGSGKSTTMAAMLDWINSNRKGHIVTIEDPIEYYFENKNCLISQREIDSDTNSFGDSLRAVMRQDPNIIIVGEIRDNETMETVLKLCSTGHLVISTIHTSSSSQTLHRILSLFPHERHKMILSQLSDTLLAIVNQRLVPTIDSELVAIFELMLANTAIKNAVRGGDIMQIENTILTSSKEGMLTFKRHIDQLALQGRLDRTKALSAIE
jgi:twitching motility protein PilT